MSDNTPPSQMLRVPSALVDAVKELSRLHRSGYTSAVLTGLQQLIASIDNTADSVSSVAAGKSDTELITDLIAGLDERIATQVAAQVAQLEQRIEQLQQRQSLLSSPSVAQSKLPDTTPESQADPSKPPVAECEPQEGTPLDCPPMVDNEPLENIALTLNTLEEIAAPSIETESEFTRKQMASLFDVTYEAIRQWEESGEIEKKGWEVVPESKTKKPRRYRKITG